MVGWPSRGFLALIVLTQVKNHVSTISNLHTTIRAASSLNSSHHHLHKSAQPSVPITKEMHNVPPLGHACCAGRHPAQQFFGIGTTRR